MGGACSRFSVFAYCDSVRCANRSKLFLEMRNLIFLAVIFFFSIKKDSVLKKDSMLETKITCKRRFLHDHHVCLKKLHGGVYKECYCIKPTHERQCLHFVQ